MLIGLLGLTKTFLLIQATQSSVTGVIRDGESNQPLTGAVVALTDIGRTVRSDSVGRYSFPNVPPGLQHLSIQHFGYAARSLSALVPPAGELEINIALEPAPLRLPGLVVRWRVPVRGIDPADSAVFPGREVTLAAIRSDPLLAEPDGLLALGGGHVAIDPESPSGLNVRGAASDQTAYQLDGIPVFSPYHSAGTFSAWNPDALDRVRISTASPLLDGSDALSGAVAGVTRSPGPQLQLQGAVSTTQARAVVDGPAGKSGAGYLLSFRTGYPGLVAPKDELSYVQGATRDLLAKLEFPAAGGRLRFVLYDARNGVDAAAFANADGSAPDFTNTYHWHSQSVGLQWSRSMNRTALRVQAWTASAAANADWILADTDAVALTSHRRDGGILATLERGDARSSSTAGARMEWSGTRYRISPASGGTPLMSLTDQTPIASVFLQHHRTLNSELALDLGGSGTLADGETYLNLLGQMRWRVSSPLALSLNYSRTHQFAQSLRNSESVVGNVFPADLYIGTGAPGVPVARSDRAVVSAEYRPWPGVRLGAEAYVSAYSGLLLVAPRTGEPFATGGFTTGSGLVPGFSLEAGVSRPSYGIRGIYGWQRVRLEHADSTYTPSYGATHLIEVGAIVFPWTNSSVRVGATGVFGRRATPVAGGFEWESCNLFDRGCEFGGSPRTTAALGSIDLPAYVRLDVSVRRQWHLLMGNRQVTMGLFATLSNLLGRRNLLTMTTDPITGRRTPIEMRPFAPLVAGLDWRF